MKEKEALCEDINDLLEKNEEQTDQIYELQIQLQNGQEQNEELNDHIQHIKEKVHKLKQQHSQKVIQ